MDVKYHRWLLDTFDERLHGDYDFDVLPDSTAVTKRCAQAREFLAAAKKYLTEL